MPRGTAVLFRLSTCYAYTSRWNGHLACPRCFADYLLVRRSFPRRPLDRRPIRDFQDPSEFVSETKV